MFTIFEKKQNIMTVESWEQMEESTVNLEKIDSSVSRVFLVLTITLFSIATLFVTYFMTNENTKVINQNISIVNNKVDTLLVKQLKSNEIISAVENRQIVNQQVVADSVTSVLRSLNQNLKESNENKESMDRLNKELKLLKSKIK